MVFSSFVFLCFFLPVAFILYWAIPNIKIKNIVLMAASLVFYAFGEPVYIILLIVSVLFNYIFGLIIEKKRSKATLVAALLFNVSLLVVFKYLVFLVSSLNLLPFALKIPEPAISLPIGISFYTFQALSYVIDVYRKNVKAQKNFAGLLLYISFFPQLIAGPIVKYHDFEDQMFSRKTDSEKIKDGIIRFCIGLSKKILIANRMGIVADYTFGLDEANLSTPVAWLGAFAYMMQIYYDFSGYSDMAIGLGKMFGFDFNENFNYPYISSSIKEFWRRWHISLSTWFKEYLYIPLGGNRKGKARTLLNKYIVFAVTGIWHGANWTFLIWGLYHGTLLVIEELFRGFGFYKKIKDSIVLKIAGCVYALIAVCIGFVIFRADSIVEAVVFIKNMFFTDLSVHVNGFYTFFSPLYIFIFACAIVGCTGVFKIVAEKIRKKADIVLMIYGLAVLLLCLMSLASQSYNPFIYLRF